MVLHEILAKSQLMEVTATLFRTDSFEDMVASHALYTRALDVVALLVQNRRLSSLITGSRAICSVGLYDMTTALSQPRAEEVKVSRCCGVSMSNCAFTNDSLAHP